MNEMIMNNFIIDQTIGMGSLEAEFGPPDLELK